ncbi:DUF1828 domain-containing protein [Bifidobacterium simiiventris]|uniref:DUF1828 domain-containing protein n=1 Tax=Bifidobacterium simiiventris TaxID=2834434 RepID=UPI001C59B695|nr:DUF1828 domain-containing protein [Bifidobacterium simiiventris]MBW3079555.1 DUF1828 domain-containing protein [Bifidobacterium simiiventris]
MNAVGTDTLIAEYGEWLKHESSLQTHGNWREITLPFLDQSNDDLCFYAESDGVSINFTDDGYTLEMFRQNGVTLTDARIGRMQRIAHKFGAKIEQNGSVTLFSDNERADAMNRYVQALSGINAVMEASHHCVTE